MATSTNVLRMRRAALAALLACSSLSLWAATKGPDGGGYIATDEVIASFVDISGASGAAGVLAGTDDGTAALTLPFPFRFYGLPYALACVSANGALYFVAASGDCAGFEADFANVDLTAAAVPKDKPALLPLWTDLTFQVAGAGSVLYQTVGDTPNRRFIVQWNNAFPQGSSVPVTFQAILFEADSKVRFQYKEVALTGGDPARNGGRATVGIRNSGAPLNGQQLQWSYNAAVIGNDTAVELAVGDSAGPAIAARATPSSIWPPTGKTVTVRVQGTIVDAVSAVASASYSVTDEYGAALPSGAIALGTGGAFTITVPLVADRRGDDADGRIYTVTIKASDVLGNQSTLALVIPVPHDQRK